MGLPAVWGPIVVRLDAEPQAVLREGKGRGYDRNGSLVG